MRFICLMVTLFVAFTFPQDGTRQILSPMTELTDLSAADLQVFEDGKVYLHRRAH